MWMSSIRNIIKNKVFIIAEIGVNHNGSISIAKKSIKRQKIWSGCCQVSIIQCR